jgi:hypothetical protein
MTVVPCGNEALQVPPEQVNPDGLLVTLPLPSPVKETLNERDTVGLDAKVALTEAEEVERATTHEPVPVHAPPHPANVLPLLGAASRVTFDPFENVPEHAPLEQDRPAGLLVTFPSPLIETDNRLSVSITALDTSTLGGLSFPAASNAVTEK